MSDRWAVYWDEIDHVWRTEPCTGWIDLSLVVFEGHSTWREAFDHADRMARRPR